MSMMAISMQHEQATVYTVPINMQCEQTHLSVHLMPLAAARGASLGTTGCGKKARASRVRRGRRFLFDELLGASGLSLDIFTAIHGF